MKSLSSMGNQDLLALMPRLVLLERQSSAEVIEHLMEIDGRRLYLDEACASLSSFCTERLGYSEDEAFKRVRVARLAVRGATPDTTLFGQRAKSRLQDAIAVPTFMRGTEYPSGTGP